MYQLHDFVIIPSCCFSCFVLFSFNEHKNLLFILLLVRDKVGDIQKEHCKGLDELREEVSKLRCLVADIVKG